MHVPYKIQTWRSNVSSAAGSAGWFSATLSMATHVISICVYSTFAIDLSPLGGGEVGTKWNKENERKHALNVNECKHALNVSFLASE